MYNMFGEIFWHSGRAFICHEGQGSGSRIGESHFHDNGGVEASIDIWTPHKNCLAHAGSGKWVKLTRAASVVMAAKTTRPGSRAIDLQLAGKYTATV